MCIRDRPWRDIEGKSQKVILVYFFYNVFKLLHPLSRTDKPVTVVCLGISAWHGVHFKFRKCAPELTLHFVGFRLDTVFFKMYSMNYSSKAYYRTEYEVLASANSNGSVTNFLTASAVSYTHLDVYKRQVQTVTSFI